MGLLDTLKQMSTGKKEDVQEESISAKPISTVEKEMETEIRNIKDTFKSIDDIMSDEEYQHILNSVNYECEQEGFSRDQILVKMYGDIVNPKTGKKFSIPNLDYLDPNYVVKYARYMQILVERPKDFVKIMNWE